MMSTRVLGGLFLLVLPVLPVTTTAQLPQYFVPPAAKPGSSLQLALVGQPGHAFASYADLNGGPRSLLGEEIFLGLSPALTLIDSGVFGIGGLRVQPIQVPATGIPTGVVIYLQSLVVDSQAPNSVFRVSNGESMVFYNSSAVMVEEFTDPVLQGFTGTYDQTRRHRLQGAAPRHRLHTVKPTQGAKFASPLFGPINPYGTRLQMVYRAGDLGASGQREVLRAFRWLPLGQVSTATYKRLLVDVGHSRVVPDYSVGTFTLLPLYPASGLSWTFASNPKSGETPVRIVDQSYTVRPQDVRTDGYVSYPTPTRAFTYNGFDSLLLDFRMEATPNLVTANGQQVHLMVTTSPRPDGRVVAGGSRTAPVNPHTATQGRGDNTMFYMQFEFASVESAALSPWRKAPVARPNYHAPTIAKSEPPGTSIRIEFRGADTATGTNATIWTTDVNNADRKPFLQYRITLFANPWTNAVPSIEAIVIPIN
ncbi:MAG: hypothetical protein ACYTGO_16010 [Planctomycetota bacterium]|jgi:hypothetical protein